MLDQLAALNDAGAFALLMAAVIIQRRWCRYVNAPYSILLLGIWIALGGEGVRRLIGGAWLLNHDFGKIVPPAWFEMAALMATAVMLFGLAVLLRETAERAWPYLVALIAVVYLAATVETWLT
jgi:hypothetical protein